ncbi:MAG: hypothetical protein KJN79_09410 [Gammaproteobacteria bacterium]|nr:hypothetical protein [Gammaproteobacteria bacterium]
MTTYLLSSIRNLQTCNVNVPPAVEVEAVVDAVTGAWPGPECYTATAELGIAQDDSDLIAEIIAEYDLGCTVDECSRALEAAVLDQVAEIEAERALGLIDG